MRDFTSTGLKPVNPIHFFNERGTSVLTEAQLVAENRRLQDEVDSLRRTVQSMAARIREFSEGQIAG